jgi:hypothetical protein
MNARVTSPEALRALDLLLAQPMPAPAPRGLQ